MDDDDSQSNSRDRNDGNGGSDHHNGGGGGGSDGVGGGIHTNATSAAGVVKQPFGDDLGDRGDDGGSAERNAAASAPCSSSSERRPVDDQLKSDRLKKKRRLEEAQLDLEDAQEEAWQKEKKGGVLTEPERLLAETHQKRLDDDGGGDAYCSPGFTPAHAEWKRSMNDVFVKLVRQYAPAPSPLFYLEGAEMHTTTRLRQEGVSPDRLYVANDQTKTALVLRASGDIGHVFELDATDALQSEALVELAFGGAYLDGCGGTYEGMERMLGALLTAERYAVASSIVIGVTLTGRDPKGQHLAVRFDGVNRFIAKCAIVLKRDSILISSR